MPGTQNILGDYRRLSIAIALNAPLVLTILLRSIGVAGFDTLSWVYFLSVGLGYYVLALYVIASLFYFVLSPVRWLAFTVAGAVTCVMVYFLLIDSFVFQIVRMHIDFFWLEWIINDFGAFGISRATLGGAAVALVIVVVVEAAIFVLARRMKQRKRTALIAWILLVLFFATGQIIHAVAYEENDVRITSLTPQLPFYVPVTSHRNASRYGGMLPIGEDEYAGDSDGPNTIHYPRNEMRWDRLAGGTTPNIVVLFFESWRYDAMNDSVTPNVAALGRKSTVFRNHFCSGNSTVAGLFGFFYGLHPTYWPAVKAENLTIHNPVLIDALTERGYTFGIYANSNFLRHKVKDAIFRDIDVHEDFEGYTEVERDSVMTEELKLFFRQQKQSGDPFMAFGFYKSNHAPYTFWYTDTVFRPSGDLNLIGAGKDTDPTLYMNDYRNATHFVDRQIGHVLNELDTLGLMDNTIIIVSTDHGEEFNDNREGFWGHGSNYTQYQTRIPLVFFAPDRTPQVIDRVTAHVDIVPTLLGEYFGCLNPPADYSNGRSLFSDDTLPRPLVIGSYVNHAFVIGDNVFEVNHLFVKDYKLSDITAKASAPAPEDLKTIADEVSVFLSPKEVTSAANP